MPDAIKIIIKDKFTNKLVALKLKEDTSLSRVIDVLKKRYEHLQNKDISLVLRGEELAINLTLHDLVDKKNYTEKERIEIVEQQPASAAATPSAVSLPETKQEPNFVQMMSQGQEQFDQAILEILVRRRVLLRELAESAMSMAQQTQRSFVTALIEDAYLAEKDILTNVSRYLEIPSIDLEGITIDPKVLSLISQEHAEYYCVMPIRCEGGTVCVAMANPFDANKLHDLRMLTGQNIEAMLSSEPAIRAKIKTAYQQSAIPEALPFEPEEGALPDDLFSAPEGASRKGPLVIKDGKKIEDSKGIAPEEYEAPTLWADKSEEILRPVDLEEEPSAPPAKPQGKDAQGKGTKTQGKDAIWEAPTVHDKSKKTAAVPVPQQPADEMAGMEISPNEDGKEITPVEAAWDEASMGGAIPIYAGLNPDEIPQAIEIGAESETGPESAVPYNQAMPPSDLIKTERMEMSRKGLSNAVEPKLELPKDIGVTPEEAALENAIRLEKFAEDEAPAIVPDGEETAAKTETEGQAETSESTPPLDLSLPSENKEEIPSGDALQGFDLSVPEEPAATQADEPAATSDQEVPEQPLEEMLRATTASASQESDFRKTWPKAFVAPPAEGIIRMEASEEEAERQLAPEPEHPIAPAETKTPASVATPMPVTEGIAGPDAGKLDVARSKAEELLQMQERLASTLEDVNSKARNLLQTHAALNEDASRMAQTRKKEASPVADTDGAPVKPSLQKIVRQVAVRYFRRMHPLQTLPLTVILSHLKQDIPMGKGMEQAQGKPVEVKKENPWVKVIPSIPGCLTVPHDAVVDVTPQSSDVKFWLTPLGEGKIDGGVVEIWYQNKCLQKVSVAISVVQQWPAKLAVACGLFFPALSFFYDIYGGLWLQRLPENMQNWLGQLPKLAEPLGGMLNLGLAVGGGFLFLAMLLALLRKTKAAQPVSATFDYEH
jgi:hypothetical protein